MDDANDLATAHLLEELRTSALDLRSVTDELLTGSVLTEERAARMDVAVAQVLLAESRLYEHLYPGRFAPGGYQSGE
jgi:hypothetical protein